MVHLGPVNLLSAACMTILFLQITLSFRQANGEKSCLMTIWPVTVPFFQCHLNLPFLKYLYLEIWPWKSKVKVMGSKVKVMYWYNSSVLRWQLMNEANLKDLIAATGLVILLELDSNCYVGQCDLEIQWMTSKNNRAPLLYYVKHCASFQSHQWIQTGVAIRKSSTRVKTGDFFVLCDLEIWRMTLKNNRAPLLYYVKLCTSFQRHMLIQTRVTVWKCSIHVTLKFDRWPSKNNRHIFYATSNFVHHFIAISVFKQELQSGNVKFGWKSIICLSSVTLKNNKAPLLCYLKLCASFSSHQWIQIGVTVQKCPIWVKIKDFLCHKTLKFARRSWKTIGHLSYATSSFVYHLIAICEFKPELGSGNG